jgi:hypothetical protein
MILGSLMILRSNPFTAAPRTPPRFPPQRGVASTFQE